MLKGAANANKNPEFNLKVACQNCNSLNASTNNAIFEQKIAMIKTIAADIIFLSDIRLEQSEAKFAAGLISIPGRKYYALQNSTKKNRGVAILIATDINFKVIDLKKEPNENAIVASVLIDDKPLILTAVYGPNKLDPQFFQWLKTNTADYRNLPVIMGGDWNTVWLGTDPELEILNMNQIPNPPHANMVYELANEYRFTDPYRIIHGEKLEFSYVPFGTLRNNRSRIDFFLVSESIMPKIISCGISVATLSATFDHKCICLTIGKNHTENKLPPQLKNLGLQSPILRIAVTIAAYKTCLYALNRFENEDINAAFEQGIAVINNLTEWYRALIRQVITLAKAGCEPDIGSGSGTGTGNGAGPGAGPNGFGNLYSNDIIDSIPPHLYDPAVEREIERLLQDLPDFNLLCNMNLRCNYTEFFERLTEHIKTAAIKAQTIIGKAITIAKKQLSTEKEGLAMQYEANLNAISSIEKRITAIDDNKYRLKIQDQKAFEILQYEKANPNFLNILNAKKCEPTLNCIKNNSGDFASEEERSEYIVNFYYSLYRHDPAVQGEIEDFLGPDIVRHPIVRNSILNVNEQAFMDSDLTAAELEKALSESNVGSAPGIDGYSYRFIRAYWHFFKYPLLKCAQTGLENNNLPQSFKTAQIKLIPKKADASNIKNWRPISLLSNFYKIISRAINNRLKKVSDRVLSRSQKGFCKSRIIQEALINILEHIDYCNSNNVPGALVAIDQAKAFDATWHKYLLSSALENNFAK